MKHPKLLQDIYIYSLSIVSIIFLFFLLHLYPIQNWNDIAFWLVLAVISETFLITSPSGLSFSVGTAIYSLLILVSDPFTVAITASFGVLLRLSKFPKNYIDIIKHIKSALLNFSLYSLTFGTSALFYIHVFEKSNLFLTSLALVLALVLCELESLIIFIILLKINASVTINTLIDQLKGTLPSTIAIGSTGLFFAFIVQQFDKNVIILLLAPLLLARYSFKLYFDSQRMAMETVRALNDALLVKDEYTGGHATRVEEYAIKLAKAHGLKSKHIDLIKSAAKLHDIGKIGIPDAILNKIGKLTDEEFDIIKTHPKMGGQILSNVDTLKKETHFIVHHHERHDGRGYPDGLKGDEIPLEASILMIADSYDAMTSDRPYRKGLTKEYAIEQFRLYKGTQFHPELADLFISVLEEEL